MKTFILYIKTFNNNINCRWLFNVAVNQMMPPPHGQVAISAQDRDARALWRDDYRKATAVLRPSDRTVPQRGRCLGLSHRVLARSGPTHGMELNFAYDFAVASDRREPARKGATAYRQKSRRHVPDCASSCMCPWATRRLQAIAYVDGRKS